MDVRIKVSETVRKIIRKRQIDRESKRKGKRERE
jgi:hypothetical protein